MMNRVIRISVLCRQQLRLEAGYDNCVPCPKIVNSKWLNRKSANNK